MRRIDHLFLEYGESHQNETNKAIHWVCVPLIFWSLLGFISLLPAPHFCSGLFGCISVASLVVILLVTVFYLRLSWILAGLMLILMLVAEIILYNVNVALGNRSWTVYLAVFVLSWAGQFYGHKVEGKKPSFLKDLQFLLVGPAWLLHFLLKKAKLPY